jgi:hypothetical protein
MRHPSGIFVQLGRLRPHNTASGPRRILYNGTRRPVTHEALEQFTQAAGTELASTSTAQSPDSFKAINTPLNISASLRSVESSLFNKDSVAYEPVVLPPVPVKLRDSPFVQQFSEGKEDVDDWDSEGKLDASQSIPIASNLSSGRTSGSSHAESFSQHLRRQPGQRTALSAPNAFIAANRRNRSVPPTRQAPNGLNRERKAALPAGAAVLSQSKRNTARPRPGGTAQLLGPSRRIKLSNGTLVDVYASMVVLQNPETGEHNAISYPRLREMCECDMCVDSSTRQRNFTLGQLMLEVKNAGWLEATPDGTQLYTQKENLVVKWPSHTSRISFRQLHRSTRPVSLTTHELTRANRRKFWTNPDLLVGMMGQPDLSEEASLPLDVRVPYQAVFPNSGDINKTAHTSLLSRLHRYGIAVLCGVPTSQTDNEDCTLRAVAESIGPIRHTFYGETWNVKSMPQSKNVAYTDVNLGLHMDLL